MLPAGEDLDALRERVRRATRGRPFRTLVPRPRALAGLDAGAAASMDVALAEKAVEKLQSGREPLPAELEALELGLRLARPALRITAGRLPESPALALEPGTRATVEALLSSVALIGWDDGTPLASGFLVSPRALATNRHVAEYLVGSGVVGPSLRALAWFGGDALPPSPAAVPITGVLEAHPAEDFALLELARAAPAPAPARLHRSPCLAAGDRVVVVGYPLFDERNPHFLDALFEGTYAVMRASPGELTSVRGARFHHDCSTLRGSSGSPILDYRSGQVVGIHTSGQFALRNTALSTAAVHAVPELRERIAAWR